MSGLKVCVRTLSSEQCAWALPAEATIWEVQLLVKEEFQIRMRHQRLVVGREVITGRYPLTAFAPQDLLQITLVVSQEMRCGWCGDTREKMPACSGCRGAFYCNRRCQRKAWRGHKLRCPYCALAPLASFDGVEKQSGAFAGNAPFFRGLSPVSAQPYAPLRVSKKMCINPQPCSSDFAPLRGATRLA